MTIYFKNTAVFFFIILISASFAGCAYNYVKPALTYIKPKLVYAPKSVVLKRLAKNYGGFKRMSGRVNVIFFHNGRSFEIPGLYKYSRGSYIKFVTTDAYGNVVFFGKITKNNATFLSPKDGSEHTVLFKKIFKKMYDNKLNSFKRIFKSLKILLNMDSIYKLKRADIFYDTEYGYFFEYNGKNYDYYISVNSLYLVDNIIMVKNGRKFDVVRFKKYIKKNGVFIPLKISVDDYLYNVKISMRISEKSAVFTGN